MSRKSLVANTRRVLHAASGGAAASTHCATPRHLNSALGPDVGIDLEGRRPSARRRWRDRARRCDGTACRAQATRDEDWNGLLARLLVGLAASRDLARAVAPGDLELVDVLRRDLVQRREPRPALVVAVLRPVVGRQRPPPTRATRTVAYTTCNCSGAADGRRKRRWSNSASTRSARRQVQTPWKQTAGVVTRRNRAQPLALGRGKAQPHALGPALEVTLVHVARRRCTVAARPW
jgi:hypothetical protein